MKEPETYRVEADSLFIFRNIYYLNLNDCTDLKT